MLASCNFQLDKFVNLLAQKKTRNKSQIYWVKLGGSWWPNRWLLRLYSHKRPARKSNSTFYVVKSFLLCSFLYFKNRKNYVIWVSKSNLTTPQVLNTLTSRLFTKKSFKNQSIGEYVSLPFGHRKTQLSPPDSSERIFAKSAKLPLSDAATTASNK